MQAHENRIIQETTWYVLGMMLLAIAITMLVFG